MVVLGMPPVGSREGNAKARVPCGAPESDLNPVGRDVDRAVGGREDVVAADEGAATEGVAFF